MDIYADFDKTDSCGRYEFQIEIEVSSSDNHFVALPVLWSLSRHPDARLLFSFSRKLVPLI